MLGARWSVLLQQFSPADFGIVSLLFPKLPLHQAAELGNSALASHPIAAHPRVGLLGTMLHAIQSPQRGDTSPAGPLGVDAAVKAI